MLWGTGGRVVQTARPTTRFWPTYGTPYDTGCGGSNLSRLAGRELRAGRTRRKQPAEGNAGCEVRSYWSFGRRGVTLVQRTGYIFECTRVDARQRCADAVPVGLGTGSTPVRTCGTKERRS